MDIHLIELFTTKKKPYRERQFLSGWDTDRKPKFRPIPLTRLDTDRIIACISPLLSVRKVLRDRIHLVSFREFQEPKARAGSRSKKGKANGQLQG